MSFDQQIAAFREHAQQTIHDNQAALARHEEPLFVNVPRVLISEEDIERALAQEA